MEVLCSNQQDMDMIDILWKQDIDLGARREVFDYNHRQKEHELQRQRKLEEAKRLHLMQEQQKALLAQLQVDEETGEYVPCSLPSNSAVAPLEVTQNVGFTDDSANGMSLDECMQLLAETFHVEEPEPTPLDTPAVPVPPRDIVMPLKDPGASPASFEDQLTAPQKMSPDLEQAWMELLSLPELQQCLNMQMMDTLETTTYPLPNIPELQSANYPDNQLIQSTTFYPMTNTTDVRKNNLNVDHTQFMNTFNGSVSSVAPSADISHMKMEAPQINSNHRPENFCDIFSSDFVMDQSCHQHGLEEKEMPDSSNKSPFTLMDFCLPPENAPHSGKQHLIAELPDSDSGISTNASPNASSPSKSMYEGSNCDSDMEELENPGSAESDYSEMFSLNFQPDDLDLLVPLSAPTEQHPHLDKKTKHHKAEPTEKSGKDGTPFTKDKSKKHDVRLSRDEHKAKALKIPFTVSMIINLPVDDFNEMMSKHQLNEAQLALVRDIRRRGKNKVAAQNCRKRKMDNIIGLETDLDTLKEEKDRLLGEKSKNVTDLKEMKRQLNSLYLEVFGMLKDEKGNSYSPSEYSLQQSTNGSIFLVPRIKKT